MDIELTVQDNEKGNRHLRKKKLVFPETRRNEISGLSNDSPIS